MSYWFRLWYNPAFASQQERQKWWIQICFFKKTFWDNLFLEANAPKKDIVTALCDNSYFHWLISHSRYYYLWTYCICGNRVVVSLWVFPSSWMASVGGFFSEAGLVVAYWATAKGLNKTSVSCPCFVDCWLRDLLQLSIPSQVRWKLVSLAF